MNYSLLLLLCLSFYGYSQPNCNVYKMEGNQPCYEACLTAIQAAQGQGLRSSQEQFDKAIQQCPQMDYAFMEKSVPYLKRGDFITWKKIIDQAVAINPTGHLGYRGWCRYQFLRDYRGAIRDFEKLDSLLPYDIGYSQNGDYHLNIAKALCYKAIGKNQKAIIIIEEQLSQKSYSPMIYDYLHLGILMTEVNDRDKAIVYFNKSISYNDYLAEPYYYLGLIYKKKKEVEAFKTNMQKAKAYYEKGYKRTDAYTHPIDQVYLSDIERELNNIEL